MRTRFLSSSEFRSGKACMSASGFVATLIWIEENYAALLTHLKEFSAWSRGSRGDRWLSLLLWLSLGLALLWLVCLPVRYGGAGGSYYFSFSREF